jgi:hypothetical protein
MHICLFITCDIQVMDLLCFFQTSSMYYLDAVHSNHQPCAEIRNSARKHCRNMSLASIDR